MNKVAKLSLAGMWFSIAGFITTNILWCYRYGYFGYKDSDMYRGTIHSFSYIGRFMKRYYGSMEFRLILVFLLGFLLCWLYFRDSYLLKEEK